MPVLAIYSNQHLRSLYFLNLARGLGIDMNSSVKLGISESDAPFVAAAWLTRSFTAFDLGAQAVEYAVDFWQRWFLFLDGLRQRGNNFFEHQAQTAPNVLAFECELVSSGLTLPRPVNDALVRIVRRQSWYRPQETPFIVFDRRAG